MICIADCDRERSVNLVELAVIPGSIKAHKSADWRMPWWKARNYDLYGFTLLVLSMTIGGIAYTTRYAMVLLRFIQYKEKQA
jgi:hypothetical protein